jgi:hypothetical protein
MVEGLDLYQAGIGGEQAGGLESLMPAMFGIFK